MFRMLPRPCQSKLIRRPRRPPDSSIRPDARYFARNSQLLVVSPYTPRPQPPFLTASSGGQLHRGQWQIRRFLTTEKRARLIQRLKTEGKNGFMVGLIFAFTTLTVFVGVHLAIEEKKPSPRCWTMVSRMRWRNAYAFHDLEVGDVDGPWWSPVESWNRNLMDRLEDPEIDGEGLIRQNGADFDVSIKDEIGYDLSNKSEEWREGYYQCLFNYAEACEHLEGWVRPNFGQQTAVPGTIVIGPSNPTPVEVDFPEMARKLGVRPPREEECIPAAPGPESVYVKILTTKGFTTKHRVTAAIAYGDWLEFKGLHDSAEETYRWALDIAMSAVSDPESLIDPATAVVSAKATGVTENILKAATSLGTHFAQTARPTVALPIFLSVLRARRSAPEVTPDSSEATFSYEEPEPPARTDIEAIGRSFRNMKNWIVAAFEEPEFPLPKLTGNEPFTRHKGGVDMCDDAKLQGYIAEILYATSTNEQGKADAIRWTKDAFGSTVKGLAAVDMSVTDKVKCIDCQRVEVENLVAMTKKLAAAEKQRNDARASGWRAKLGGAQQPDERWHREWWDAKELVDKHFKEDLRGKLTIVPFGSSWKWFRGFMHW